MNSKKNIFRKILMHMIKTQPSAHPICKCNPLLHIKLTQCPRLFPISVHTEMAEELGKDFYLCVITSAASVYNRYVIGQPDEILICSLRRAVNGAFFGRNAEFSAASSGHWIRTQLAPLHGIHTESAAFRCFDSPLLSGKSPRCVTTDLH